MLAIPWWNIPARRRRARFIQQRLMAFNAKLDRTLRAIEDADAASFESELSGADGRFGSAEPITGAEEF